MASINERLGRITVRNLITLVIGLLLLLPLRLAAQPAKPATLAELAMYTGPDREQMLAAGA